MNELYYPHRVQLTPSVGDGDIEFVVMRNAAGNADLMEFIANNVRKAARNFRGLRVGDTESKIFKQGTETLWQPTEPGSITAFGVSAGPRHARMFGYAKNLLRPKSFTQDEVVAFHNDLLAGSTMVWKIAESRLPTDVMGDLINKLDESGLPGIFTSHVPEGK